MADAPDSGSRPPGEKRYDPTKVRLARLSWLIPLVCLGVTLFVNAVRMQQPANRVAGWIGAAGFVLFVAGVAVGFVLAVVSLALSVSYRGVLGHAVGGLAASVALGLLIVGLFWALATLRAIQERQRGGRPGVQQTAPPACRRPSGPACRVRSAPPAPVAEPGHLPFPADDARRVRRAIRVAGAGALRGRG